MTKYVLNSGGLRNNLPKAREFMSEVFKGLSNKPKMLVVLFAQPRELWETNFVKYQQEMNERTPAGVSPLYELAMPATFAEQVKNADVVYMHGGDDHLLKYWLSQFEVPKLWEGKVVAGSSAGSDVLVSHYWTCDWRQNMDGLGIVPIKFIPHYKSEFGADDPLRGAINWEAAHKELEAYGPSDMPIYALPEGHFVVFEQ